MQRLAPAALALPLFMVLPSAQAVEPGGPGRVISSQEAVGILARDKFALWSDPQSGYWQTAQKTLGKVYSDRHNQPIWVNSDGLNNRALAAIHEIEKAADYGLDRKDFSLPDTGKGDIPYSVDKLARIEVQVTAAVLRYAHHAKGGRLKPTELSPYLDRAPRPPSPEEVLVGIAASDDAAAFLRKLHPQHKQFQALRRKYLALLSKDHGNRNVHLPSGPALKIGMRHPQVALLRKRLGVPLLDNHHGVSQSDPELFDQRLAKAVVEFQKNRGLKTDGIVGNRTRGFLNVSDSEKAQRILVNMERWRWMPDALGNLYVWANIPEFRVRVMQKGHPIHSERLVAGKVQNQTPIFSDEMERIEFHPYWNVPDSIKVKEILPSLRHSTRILRRQNLRIKYRGREINPAAVDWNRVDVRRFHFYQPPGGRNALGFVKFMFPNKHAVYMHDTPTKHLFSRSVRAFSHGCMRIRNPRKLAEVLLRLDKGWSPAKVGRVIAAGVHRPVQLNEKIPVHITYFTARVTEDGKLTTFGDYYGHDRLIGMALNGKTLRVAYGAESTNGRRQRRQASVNSSGGSATSRWAREAFGSRN